MEKKHFPKGFMHSVEKNQNRHFNHVILFFRFSRYFSCPFQIPPKHPTQKKLASQPGRFVAAFDGRFKVEAGRFIGKPPHRNNPAVGWAWESPKENEQI